MEKKADSNRYEARLKDLISAYKRLEAEKKALELTISTLNNESSTSAETTNSTDNHQQQIQTLMRNISTLSTEKSRMEQAFQNDRRKLKKELSDKNVELENFKQKLDQISKQNAIEVGQLKSKLILAQHEREKEHNDLMEMVRELQNLLSDERRLKDNLEMQLNDLKQQFSNFSDQVKTTKTAQTTDLDRETDYRQKENIVLDSLQSQIQALKLQHKTTIESEQKRANEAIERSKNLQKIHEERVCNLEERLAELTNMVASYHRLRHSDLENIVKLKEKIAQLEVNQLEPTKIQTSQETNKSKSVLEEIFYLKELLIKENKVDVSKIFVMKDADCEIQNVQENIDKLQLELQSSHQEIENLKKKGEESSSKIVMLQEKIRNLNKTIEDCENELKNKLFEYQTNIKMEKSKWQNNLCMVETEYRSKLSQLEQQLQKQRDRSMNLLEEKDNEIRALKALYESTALSDQNPSQEMLEKEVNNLNIVLNSSGSARLTESYHDTYMIHYSNELARKDLELTKMRKAKKESESDLRKILTEKVQMKDELEEKIERLEREVERLQRYKSREGANLEYLKNVLLSFIVASSSSSKVHMLKAIGTVLKFDENEMKSAVDFIVQHKHK